MSRYDKTANEAARQVLITKKVDLHREYWEQAFGINGTNTYGETLREFIEGMFPARFYYMEEDCNSLSY